MLMHIRNWEKPDGWTQGQPEVLVAPFTSYLLGEPVVNYDSLHQYLTDDLGIPYDEKTTIKLFGGFEKSPLGGFHIPYTHTIHVNAVVAEHHHVHDGGTMRIVAHEANHRADSSQAKTRTAIEVAARWASYKVGFEVSELLPVLTHAPEVAALLSRLIYYEVEPPEIRARRAEKSNALIEHEKDILFPKADRTTFLHLTGNLSAETVSKLGFASLEQAA